MNQSDIPEYDLKMWSLFLAKAVYTDNTWLQILLVSILIVIFMVGLIGNVLTCIVIYSDRTMHTTTNFYLFNMAVSDIVVSFGIFLEVYMFCMDSYVFGNYACKIHFFFVIVLWNNSILVMTALAIERYIAIWHPLLLKPAPAWQRVMKVISFIWIIAICETAPEVLTVELVRTQNIGVCYIVPSPLARITNGILALVTFIIPLGTMLFVYTMIAFKVSVNEKSNSTKNIFNHKDNRRKINKLVVAITLSFLICWLPFFTFRLLILFFDMQRLMQMEQVWGIGYRIILVNSWLCIVLNPILFSLMSTKFRQALKILWTKKIKSKDHSAISAVSTL